MAPTNSLSDQAKARLWLIFAGLAAFLVYANCLGHGFVWDDHDLIVNDYRLDSWEYLGEIFSHDFFNQDQVVDERGYGYYRPLVTASYVVDFQRHGLEPSGFHLSNILLHVLCTGLVWLLMLQLGSTANVSGLASLLFAIHPIHTENVAWIAGRTDLLAFAFCAAAMAVHLHFEPKASALKRALGLGAASFLYLGGLLAKEMSVVLVLWLVVVHLFRDDELPAMVKTFFPYALVSLAYGVWRFVLIDVGTPGALPEHSPTVVLLSLAPTLVRYLAWLAWPMDLSAYVQNPYVTSPLEPRLWLSLLVLLTLGWLLWRSRSATAMKWAMMLAVSFFPIVNFVRIAAPPDMGNVMAERFCYFPSFPFVALISYLFFCAADRAKGLASMRARSVSRAVWWAAVFLVLVAGVMGTLLRNQDWAEEVTFFKRTLEQEPGAAILWTRLAQREIEAGELDAAERSLDAAEALYPGLYGVVSGRASLFLARGQSREALRLQEALVAQATFGRARALQNLAYLYIVDGQREKARQILEELVSSGRAYGLTHANLAGLYAVGGELEKARRHYALALDQRPGDLATGQAWAALERRSGNLETVAGIYLRLLRLHPDHPRLLNNLASVRQEEGRLEEAVAFYERALQVDPGYTVARLGYASVLRLAGRAAAAREELEIVLKSNPEAELERRARSLVTELDGISPSPANPRGDQGGGLSR